MPSDAGPKVVVQTIKFTSPARPDEPILIDVQAPQDRTKPVIIKEGITFTPCLIFKVQHGTVSGLKFTQVARRMGFSRKIEGTSGSFSARPDEPYEERYPEDKTPSGYLMRADCAPALAEHELTNADTVETRLVDDDGTVYLEFTWSAVSSFALV